MFIIDPNLRAEMMQEYLRRNMIHASAVGANSNAKAAKGRLLKTKKPAKWLIKALDGIIDRTEKVHPEIAKHRDEIEIYKEQLK